MDGYTGDRARRRLLRRPRRASGGVCATAAHGTAVDSTKEHEAWVEELLPRVRNLVRYLVRDDQEVDDLAHEALVEVLRSLGSFRGDGSRRAWVDRIVVRTVFARRRRNRGRVDTDADPVCIDSIPHGRTPPDHYAARRRALALIDRLPTEQRDAIVLHHVAGLRVREVALVVDAPEETVKSRLRLAKHRVMDLLEQGATP